MYPRRTKGAHERSDGSLATGGRRPPRRLAGGASLLALAALLAGGLTGCGETQPDSSAPDCPPEECVIVGVGQPIYLGLLLNDDSASGQDTEDTVRLGIDYLDGEFDGVDGQLYGHSVVLVESPEDCTPESGIKAAELLLDQPDLLAVIGTTCSAAAFDAAVPLLSDAKILTVSSTNTSPKLTELESRQRFYFRTAINDLIQATVGADFAIEELGLSNVATLNLPDAYSEPMAETFAGRAANQGANVVASAVAQKSGDGLEPASLLTAVAQLVQAQPELIFIPMIEAPCTEAVQVIKAVPELSGAKLLVTEGCQTQGIAAALGPQIQGVYASGPDFEGLESDAFYRDSFLPAYQRLVAERPPLVSTSASFDAINLVLAAIRRTAQPLPGGRLLINRNELREAVVGVTGYPGLSGTLDCTPLGDCVRSARVSIYEAPAWPVLEPASTPVFSQTLELSDVVTTG